MDLTVIGSGTVVPHAERVCSSYFVKAGDARLLLDCGPGAVHHLARFGVGWDRLTHVIVSHFHTDHIGDLPALLFALKYGLAQPRREPLTIAGPLGMKALWQRFAEAFGEYMRDPGFKLTIRELTDGRELDVAGSIRLRAHATPHTDASLAYRVETAGATLAYTGDTGFSEELGAFLRQTDLLIAECSLPDRLAMESHLTPSRVAALARIAEPRRLLLSHVFPQLEGQDIAALVRQAGWSGDVDIAHDGMQLHV